MKMRFLFVFYFSDMSFDTQGMGIVRHSLCKQKNLFLCCHLMSTSYMHKEDCITLVWDLLGIFSVEEDMYLEG